MFWGNSLVPLLSFLLSFWSDPYADYDTEVLWELLCLKAESSPRSWTGWTAVNMSKAVTLMSPITIINTIINHHHWPPPYHHLDHLPDRDDGLDALDRIDWTDLWSQLMQELRTGVKVNIWTFSKHLGEEWQSPVEEGWTVGQVRVLSHPVWNADGWYQVDNISNLLKHLHLHFSEECTHHLIQGLKDSNWRM